MKLEHHRDLQRRDLWPRSAQETALFLLEGGDSLVDSVSPNVMIGSQDRSLMVVYLAGDLSAGWVMTPRERLLHLLPENQQSVQWAESQSQHGAKVNG
ncbi:hypothetical protein JOB18_025036 [Solea senegalensis]|uniref:Uncharacterized protein n=1 Tax=Solea senegalensis TaxID=28829 RepID=A0AAV6Q4T2_SOLSE|nr:hypothetical protein JOB18_025036 [Solea senegalensis]